MAVKTVSLVSLSGQNSVDSLLSNPKWGSTALTFSFRTTAPLGSEYALGFAPLCATQKNAVRQALAKWSAVSGLTFSEVSDSANSILRFGTCSSQVVETSQAYFPSTSASGGSVWFGNSNSNAPTEPNKGNYAYLTFLHEIGHSLGLKHPHEADEPGFPVAASSIDAMQYSVMSYRSYVGGSVDGGYSNADDSYAYGPMINDIAAIQYLYGADYSYRSGNTTYSFSPSTAKIFEAVWDGGGTDTFDCSQYSTGVSVNLSPGAWSIFSSDQIADLGNGYSSPGNVQNAYLFNGNTASLIENAMGGSGDDILTGNQANNVLRGGAGEDRLSGVAGNDQLWGGYGDDTLVDANGSNAYWWGSSEGNDVVSGTSGKDALYFYNFSFSQRVGSFTAGGDMTFGCKTGDSSVVTLSGWRNQVANSRVQSLVFSENGILKAYAWNDHQPVTVNLFDGAYSLRGVHDLECVDSSNATLRGSSGDDTIRGGSGNDVIWGAAGSDVLIGGGGADAYYWGSGDGNDQIRDAGSGESVMLYTAGLSTGNVSVSVVGTTLTLTGAAQTLSIENWNTGGLNRFVFGTTASATNVYKVVSTGSGYGWQQE